MSSKVCIECKLEKDLETGFHKEVRDGITTYRNVCRPCKNKRTLLQKKPETFAKTRAQRSAKHKFQRKNLIGVENYIWEDTRKDDRKNDYENDLTKEYIRELIKDGCSYCGENTMRITLDRMDNSKGHTKENCVPACLRCNNIRNSMPYPAWLAIVPAIKDATQKGIFGNWVGGIKQFLE